MHSLRRFTLAAAGTVALLSAPLLPAQQQQTPPAVRPGDYAVRFLDRTIDLRPYFQGFPYLGWDFDFDSRRLFYFHETPAGRFLMTQPLRVGRGSGLVDPAAGKRLNEVDWSKRSYSPMRYDSVTRSMVMQGDERNDERFNLYRVSLRDGSLTKLTDVPYIYGWDWSKDNRTIGYVARFGAGEPYRSCVRVMPAAGGEGRDVVCETAGAHRLTWSGVNFRPDGSGAVVQVNRGGHRKQANLAWVDLTAAQPKLEILLPDGVERFAFGTERDWIDNDRFYYESDESGYTNLYVFDLKSRSSRQVTRVAEEASFTHIEIGGRKLVQVAYDRPHETELEVIDPATGASLGRQTFAFNLGFPGFDRKNHFVVTKTSAASPFQADEMWVTLEGGRAKWTLEPKIRLPQAYASAIEQCNVERVQYPTFDADPKTGKPRMLHAFLMTPKRPRANPAERLAVITAFYGGGNSFSTQQQIYCEAGISWLSPAVRGSSGFGKEFMALNDRDLGGDEIVDLFYGARFLEKKLGLEPRQIGVAGGSHGGYATMRALTHPPETNGRNERYPLGFGISHAGFSSIVTFYQATNIPDWIILESGDPATADSATMLDRSPLSHVARLQSPLLLTHGANDNRVGVSESRQFARAAQTLGKPVTYVEFEGQGHSIKGLANQVRNYQTQFQFLESVLQGQGAAPRPAQVP